MSDLPVVVIGAGPVGLAAAAHLAPLAAALGDRVRYGARVTGVSRQGRDRLVDAERESQPFTVHVTASEGGAAGGDAAAGETADGDECRVDARAVIDASGTWRQPGPAGNVVVLTGFRPGLSLLSEMRLDLDPVLQAPRRVAPVIDPNIHSCGTATPTLARDLAHPEPRLYLAGMKSYGRAPTFLAMTGYEQIRSIAAELAGDHEAAARTELVLPDTGVRSGGGLPDGPDAASGGGCCAPVPQKALQIGRAPITL